MHGGLGDYTARLIQALADNDWESHVLTSAQVRTDDPRVLPLVRRWNWGLSRWVPRALAEAQADVLHIQYQTGGYRMHPAINLLPRRIKRRLPSIPVVTTFHDLLPPYLFPKAGPLRAWVTRLLANSSDAVIVTNRGDFEILSVEQRFGSKVTMIPIGSNLPDVAHVDVDETRRRIGLDDPETLAIGFFGFLSQDKGVDVLLNALINRPWSQPTTFVIIGGGLATTDISNRPYLDWIERQLKDAPVPVIETGFLDPCDAAATLRSMDVVVLPFRNGASLRRGTLIAAIRAGATVLTTDPESDDSLDPLVGGETMWLAAPDDPVALREGLATLIGDRSLREQLALKARLTGMALDWNTIAKHHIEVYEDLMSRARGFHGAR